MIKLVTIVGARPQIIKSAALSRSLRSFHKDQIQEVLVHTGQHYDEGLSDVFFDELGITRPDYNLHIGPGSYGFQMSGMMEGIEMVIRKEKPHAVVVFGDTNSTLAGSLTSARLQIPVIHIEAGMRSFNKSMPEEINRITTDHISTLLFTPTVTGLNNLIREGFSVQSSPPFAPDNPGVFFCGDLMFDNTMFFEQEAKKNSTILQRFELKDKPFLLCTIHRENNTDVEENLQSIFQAILEISKEWNIKAVIPVHPRTMKALEAISDTRLLDELLSSKSIQLLPPISFFDIIQLERNARLIMTDSGGVQKEAYFFKKPCLVLRDETEWVELIQQGTTLLSGTRKERIKAVFADLIKRNDLSYPPIFGDGHAAEFICQKIFESFNDLIPFRG